MILHRVYKSPKLYPVLFSSSKPRGRLLFSQRKSKERDYDHGSGSEREAAAGVGLPLPGHLLYQCGDRSKRRAPPGPWPHPVLLVLVLAKRRAATEITCPVLGVASAWRQAPDALPISHGGTGARHAHPALVTSWGDTQLAPTFLPGTAMDPTTIPTLRCWAICRPSHEGKPGSAYPAGRKKERGERGE